MWLLDLTATDVADVRKEAADCGGENELFVRDDGRGSLVVCNGGKPKNISARREVRKVFDRGRFGKEGGAWLFFVGLWVPDDFRGEFLAWYQVEHLPVLLECPTWDGCRFVEGTAAKGYQFYALHQLSNRKALDSDERRRSRATPWFKRLADNDWFDGAFTRTLYRRI
jgi:hypothetical protein